MATIRCTVCENRFDPDRSDALPFCSERCQQRDLGCWLDEKYGLPVAGEEEEPPEIDLS